MHEEIMAVAGFVYAVETASAYAQQYERDVPWTVHTHIGSMSGMAMHGGYVVVSDDADSVRVAHQLFGLS